MSIYVYLELPGIDLNFLTTPGEKRGIRSSIGEGLEEKEGGGWSGRINERKGGGEGDGSMSMHSKNRLSGCC